MHVSAGGSTDESPPSVVLPAVWRARWLVLAAVVIAGVGGYMVSKSQPVTYSAESLMVLSASEVFDPLATQSPGEPGRFVDDQVSTIQSTAVLQRAADQLGDVDARDLSAALHVAPDGANNVITVTASADTAEEAAARANAVVGAYRGFVMDRVQAVSTDAQRVTFDPSLNNQIAARAAVYGDGVALVDPAAAPTSPSSPYPMRDAALVAAAAALATVGLALMRRAPTSGPPSMTSGPPSMGGLAPARVLGTVPVRRGRGRAVDAAEHALALVALDYARQGVPGPLLVTGTGPDSHAASVAFGLGVSAAARGRRVLLVDADPDNRELLARLDGAAPRPSDAVIRSGSAVQDGVVSVRVGDDPGTEVSVATLCGDVGGPIDQPHLQETLSAVTGAYDLVLIQSASVLTNPRAFALVGQASAVVAVAGVREGPMLLRDLQDRLAVAQRPLVGVVLTRTVRGGGRSIALTADRLVRTAGRLTTKPGLSGTSTGRPASSPRSPA